VFKLYQLAVVAPMLVGEKNTFVLDKQNNSGIEPLL